MAAPSLLKTWQIEGDNLVAAVDGYAERKTTLLGIVNKLIGFASNPWTVIGSNNASASGMDAVNRWSSISALNNNSWIVLQQAGINAKFQLCIFLNANWSSGVPQVTFVVSRLAGFGTANGGTNGSTSARPTATDEDVQTANVFGVNGASAKAYRFYVWQSTDGQVTRVLLRNATDGAYNMFFEMAKPRNPRTLWTDACYYRFSGAITLIGPPVANAAATTAYLSTTKVNTVAIYTARNAALNQINDWEGPNNYDTYRCYLGSYTLAGAKGGIIGEMFDCRYADLVVANGARLPNGGPYTWCAFTDAGAPGWLLPWDNTTTPKFTAAP